MNPQRLGSSWQHVNERLRYEQWFTQNFVELSDAARQVDVRADLHEVEPTRPSALMLALVFARPHWLVTNGK